MLVQRDCCVKDGDYGLERCGGVAGLTQLQWEANRRPPLYETEWCHIGGGKIKALDN